MKKRNSLITRILLALVVIAGFDAALTVAATPATMQIGVNLDPVAYYGQYSPWINLEHMLSGNYGNWDQGPSGPACTLNDEGFSTGQGQAYLFSSAMQDWGSGLYTITATGASVTIDGNGPGAITVPANTPTTVQFTLPAGATCYTFTTPGGLTNLSILPPGQSADGWNPHFLAAIKPFTTLRTMQWTLTNYTTETTWGSRFNPAYSQWNSGVPWEQIAGLANATGKQIWINCPYEANPAYQASLAALLAADTTNPSASYICEWSNEAWNSQFPTYAYAEAQAATIAGIPSDVGSRVSDYTALQCRAFGNVMTLALGKHALPVLCGQAGNSWLGLNGLSYLQANGGLAPIQAYAVAPYISDQGEPAGTATATILADYAATQTANAYGVGWALSATQANAAVAKQFGLPLWCYEGGTQSYPNNDANRMAAQQSASLGTLYSGTYFPGLQLAGVSLFCHYIGPASGYTFSYGSSLSTVWPKGAALIAAAHANNVVPTTQPTTVPATAPVAPTKTVTGITSTETTVITYSDGSTKSATTQQAISP